jgi:hypothetical protein
MTGKLAVLALATVATLWSGKATADYAIPVEAHVEVQSGKAKCIEVFFDCGRHIPYQGTAFVQHGRLTYRDVTINQCGNPREPGRAVCYLSDPGYRGPDEIDFPVSTGMGAIFHVNFR